MTTLKLLGKYDDNPPVGVNASDVVTGIGGLAAANNLSDVDNAATALGNLGGVAQSDVRMPMFAPLPSADTTGTTDSAALLASITAAQAAGRPLVLAAAYSSSPYWVKPGIISLSSLAGIRVYGQGQGNTWFKLAGTTDGTIFNFSHCTDVEIADFSYDGNRAGVISAGVGVINFASSSRAKATRIDGQNLPAVSGTASDALLTVLDCQHSGGEDLWTDTAGYTVVIGSPNGSTGDSRDCYARRIVGLNNDFNVIYVTGNTGGHPTGVNTIYRHTVEDVYGENFGDTCVEIGQGNVGTTTSNIRGNGGGRGLTVLLIRDNVGTIASDIYAENLGLGGAQTGVRVAPLFTQITDAQISNVTVRSPAAKGVTAAGFDGLTLSNINAYSCTQNIMIYQGDRLTVDGVRTKGSGTWGMQIGDDTLSCGTLGSTLSTGGPITTLPLTVALTTPLPPGTLLLSSGGNTQTWVTVGAAIGATTIPVTSQTPNFAYPSGGSILTGNVTNMDVQNIAEDGCVNGVSIQGASTGQYGGIHATEGLSIGANVTARRSAMPSLRMGTTQTVGFAAAVNTLYPCTGTITATLPTAAVPGEVIGIYRAATSGVITIQTAAGGGTINGQASATIGATTTTSNPMVLLQCVGTSTWQIIAALGTDAALGHRVDGIFTAAGQFNFGAQYIGHMVTKSSSTYTTSRVDWWVACGGATGITLGTASFGTGHQQVISNYNSASVTLATASGTLYGPTVLPSRSGVVMEYDGTNWHCVASWGLSPNSAQRVAISTPAPTSGTAFTPSATSDVQLYITCTTSTSLAVTMGTTTGAENTIVPTVTAPVGGFYSIVVPAGWKVVVTGTVADFTFRQQAL